MRGPLRSTRAAVAAGLTSLLPVDGAGGEGGAHAAPPDPPPFAAGLPAMLTAELARLQTPGAIVLVDVPGHGTWQAGLGVENLSTRAPIQVTDHMRIGSITKTLTATVVLELVDQHKIGLDDPVATYLPGVVPDGPDITIRQLLDMTSGLYNVTEDDHFNAVLDAEPGKVWTEQQLLAIAFGHDPYFKPGTDFHYSNTNYELLGLIAEQVGQAELAELTRRGIFAPLGMTESSLPPRTSPAIPAPFSRGYNFGTNVQANDAYKAALAGDRAHAQVDVPAGVAPTDATNWSVSYTSASGGAVSTAHDLRIWAHALATGALLSPAIHAQQLTFGAKSNYGLGVEQAPGGFVGHNGAVPGYQSFMGYHPFSQITIIVLANLQLAPNIYLSDGLPADHLYGVIRPHVTPTGG